MDFSNKVAQLRKDKKLSRDELGKAVGTSGAIIGRYERGEITPSVEVAARIAEALEVSLDYLSGISEQELNKDIIKQVNDLQSLSPEEQSHILKTLQSLVRDAKARATYG